MNDMKILLLEGGFNEEHEVSIVSASEIKKSLNNLAICYESLIVNPLNFKKDILKYKSNYICFNALHGTFGEDGKIQKILDDLSIKYTHSGAKTSETAFSKKDTKDMVKKIPISTPEYFSINIKNINFNILFNTFKNFGKFIIKPNSSGSSFGIKIIENQDDIKNFIKDYKINLKLYEKHNNLIIEKFIKGRELTVTVIEKNGKNIPLEVTEIETSKTIFDYEAKYTAGLAKHILPAKIPESIYEKCKSYAKIIHETLECKHISRSDFIYHDNLLYFLELNTHPGLTSNSLAPEQLKYNNISIDKFILEIVNSIL